jgi:hypothetical protein
MPEVNSQADLLRDSEGLLDAGERSPEVKEQIEPEFKTLEASLLNVRTLKARQEELTALRQEVTQQFKAAVVHLKESAMRYRAAVKAKLGPRNERLVHFKVAPLRKRPRKTIVVVKPQDGETSGTMPSAPASPPAKPVA